MGSIMAMLPYAEARNNARNWTLKISGRVQADADCPVTKRGIILVAQIEVVDLFVRADVEHTDE